MFLPFGHHSHGFKIQLWETNVQGKLIHVSGVRNIRTIDVGPSGRLPDDLMQVNMLEGGSWYVTAVSVGRLPVLVPSDRRADR